MQQCNLVTNSDDVRNGVAPIHPTGYEQQRQRVALSYKPHQDSTVTDSEAVFLESLTLYERDYVDELRDAYDQYYHHQISRNEFIDECEGAAVSALDTPPDRRRAIKESAVRFIRAEFKVENFHAKIKLRKRLEQAAFNFKYGERHHIGHDRCSFKMACNHSYKSARRHLVSKRHAQDRLLSCAKDAFA